MSEPWKAESVGSGQFRFTNTSGGMLAMIALNPLGSTEVRVTLGGVKDDPHVVQSSINDGDFFVATVRGEGVRITSTVWPANQHVYWEFQVP